MSIKKILLMTLTPDQKKHVEDLLRQGDELAVVRYLQKNLGMSADEALKLTEKLEKTVEESPEVKMSQFMAQAGKRTMSDSNVSKWIGGIFLFFGLVMLSVGCYIFYTNYTFAQTAVPVTGKVVDFDISYSTDDDGNTSTMYSGVFEYEYNGEVFRHTGDVASSSPDYDEGEEVEILIDPNNPNHALVNTFWDRWFVILIVGFFGVAFTGAGFMVLRLF